MSWRFSSRLRSPSSQFFLWMSASLLASILAWKMCHSCTTFDSLDWTSAASLCRRACWILLVSSVRSRSSDCCCKSFSFFSSSTLLSSNSLSFSSNSNNRPNSSSSCFCICFLLSSSSSFFAAIFFFVSSISSFPCANCLAPFSAC